MTIKKLIIFILFVLLLLPSCVPEVNETQATLTVELNTERVGQVTDLQLSASDLNRELSYTSSELTITLPVGYYDIAITGLANGKPIRANKRGVTVVKNSTIELEATFVNKEKEEFVLAEIFFAGTETPEGKRYNGDKYFVIVNNSDDTLSADGLILIEAELNSVQKYIFDGDDIREKYFAVDAMYRVPGDGSNYCVAPGKALLIVDNAMNHLEANANSFDLSSADMEWYDVSSSTGTVDVDNPNVPNMDKLYCYTYTIWVPHNQGHKSYGLARFPDSLTAEQYFQDSQYRLHITYETVTAAGTFPGAKDVYVLPNDWIVDAVNLSPYETFQWLTVSDKLDAGYAYIAPTGSDKTRFGKCVRRKRGEDGKLVDTNNSSEDFLMAQEANPFYFDR